MNFGPDLSRSAASMRVEFPEQPANATFGGKQNKTLFVTARKSLYSVEMEAQGHAFPGK